ncbi:MAG TPA: hypothetical protein VGE41_00390 [Verrucomicrobiae bacterium]
MESAHFPSRIKSIRLDIFRKTQKYKPAEKATLQRFWPGYNANAMMDQAVLWIFGVMALGGAYYMTKHYFSQESRLERKRRRNHARLVAKTNKPTMILFSVKTPKA